LISWSKYRVLKKNSAPSSVIPVHHHNHHLLLLLHFTAYGIFLFWFHLPVYKVTEEMKNAARIVGWSKAADKMER
jgi:hypothetical protein